MNSFCSFQLNAVEKHLVLPFVNEVCKTNTVPSGCHCGNKLRNPAQIAFRYIKTYVHCERYPW